MKLTKKPSLRGKKRYVYFKVHSQTPIQYTDVRNAGWNSILDLVGEMGFAKAGPHFIKNIWDPKAQRGVIRCSNSYVDQIKLALSLIHQIGDSRVIFQSLRVSGTIKGTKID